MTTATLNDPGNAGDGSPGAATRGRSRNLVARLVTHLCVLVGVLLSIFPFYWMLAMSTNTTADIFASPPKLTFGPHFVENIRNVLSNIDLVGAFVNTLIVAGALAILVMLFDSLAAFAFAKYDFPGKNVLFVILLATFLVPGSLSLVPSFVLMSAFGWIGDLRALIIPGAANAFGIFLLRQFAVRLDPRLADRVGPDGRCRLLPYLVVGGRADAARRTGVPGHLHLHRRLERLRLAADRAGRPAAADPADRPGHS